MAYHFSANQFEDQYSPRKLGNWEYPKWYPERPRQRFKSTKIIADDNGCLLEGVKGENAWGNYVGTWDLPKRITREYVKKLVAPPERLVKRWGKKKKETEPEAGSGPGSEPAGTTEEKTDEKVCVMCGKPEFECTCNKSSKGPGEICPKCGLPLSECTCNKSSKAQEETCPVCGLPLAECTCTGHSKNNKQTCPICGMSLGKCTCKSSKSKSRHSEEPETCTNLQCAKCKRDLCFCEDNCCCPT